MTATLRVRSVRRSPAGMLALVLVALAALASPARAADGVPYDDPSVAGHIGLCNKAGESISQGSLTEGPFVWAAVSSEAAPAPYDVNGRTATLFAYQPRQGVDPGEWSGKMLTASARYSDASHPKAQATDRDASLSSYLDGYPAEWGGFIQLRIYLGAPGEAALSQTYVATDIQVNGDTWRVVRGGDVDCNTGTAVSLETLTLPQNPPTTLAAEVPVAAPDATTSTTQVVDTTPTTAPLLSDGESAAPANHSSGGSSDSAVPIVLIVALASIAIGGAWWLRRGNAPGDPDG